MLESAFREFWADQMTIMRSLRRMPVWVQVWMAVLIPVNLGGLLFLDQPFAIPILIVANAAMLIVALMIPRVSGTTRLISAPHVVCRVLLISLVVHALGGGYELGEAYATYLWILLAMNVIGLALDGYSFWLWLRGDRTEI